MRFPSPILSVFRAHDGSLQADDGVIDVPAALLPVVEIPEEFRSTFYGDQGSGDIQRTSFLWSGSVTRTNQPGIASAIRLGSGIWSFEVGWQHVASYTDLVNVGGFYIALSFLSGLQDFQIAVGRPVANVVQSGYYRFRVSTTRDDLVPTAIVNTNGVGETDFFNWTWAANRLG